MTSVDAGILVLYLSIVIVWISMIVDDFRDKKREQREQDKGLPSKKED